MFNNILVSVGEADQGRQAALLAQSLGSPSAKITLVRIHGAYAIVGRGGAGAQRNAQRRLADVTLRRARQATGIQDAISYGAQSVHQGLAKLATAQRADLIVVGSSWATNAGQLALDPSLTRNLAASAPCVVAIAPTTPSASRRGSVRRVGVAFDGSPDSFRALAVARRFASRRQAQLVVFEAEGTVRSVATTYGEGTTFESLDALRELSGGFDLLVTPSRLATARRRIVGAGLVEELAGSAFAPMMIVTRNSVTPQVVGGAAPAEYLVGARR